MGEFKPVEICDFVRPGAPITEDVKYWKRLGFPCAFKEFGAIDCVDFSPQEPFKAAVTCAAKVQIYSTATNELLTTISRFKKTAYGGVFRSDGNLLVGGSEDGTFRLFEVQGNRLLRIFKGHKGATHRCRFTTDGVHLLSFSDDKTIGLWDIPTETMLQSFEEHEDYIRAGAISQVCHDLFVSGSYDHKIKLFDTRTGSSVMSFDHEVPVQSVLIYPSGGLVISAGGTNIKVWDPVAGRLLSQITQHHKTITSLCFASDGRRLMSGSLDRHVKIYDTLSYEVVHTLNYPSSILSVAAAPGDKAVGVGMTDGLFSLRQQKKDKSTEDNESSKKTSYQHHFNATDFSAYCAQDVVVPALNKTTHKRFDYLLRKFESTKALDVVLKDFIQKKNPETTISVIMELMRRGALKAAMSGREEDSLVQLMKFVTKYIGDPRFMRVLVDVGLILIELYGPKMTNPDVNRAFRYLVDSVENQVKYMTEMMELNGLLNTILTSSDIENSEGPILSDGMPPRISSP